MLGDAVKIVNHIKFRPLNARALKLRCEEMCGEHTTLLRRREIRWLAGGEVLV
jgi:hypothetical protein